MNAIRRTCVPFQVRTHPQRLAGAEADGIVEGYAAVFGNVDTYGTVLQRGAFKESLKAGLSRIKVLWNHDPDQPIGTLLYADEDPVGLFVRYRLSLGVQKARDVFQLIQDGVVDAMSFGFTIEDSVMDGEHLAIRRVTLWDVSPVTFPANAKARILSARGALPPDAVRHSLGTLLHEVRDFNNRLIGDR